MVVVMVTTQAPGEEAALRGLVGLWTLPSQSLFSLGSGRFEGAPGIIASLVALSSQITPHLLKTAASHGVEMVLVWLSFCWGL